MFENRRDSLGMKRFYNWFSRYYGLVENNIIPGLELVLANLDPKRDRFSGDHVLELACGTANLGILLAPRVARYEGRDNSESMLARAKLRWEKEVPPDCRPRYQEAPFKLINLLDFSTSDLGTPDWTAISFGIHLFEPEAELQILAKAFAASKKGVIIIDHEQRWTPVLAFIEWLEGSWYDKYVHMDFARAAKDLGAGFCSSLCKGTQTMVFTKDAKP